MTVMTTTTMPATMMMMVMFFMMGILKLMVIRRVHIHEYRYENEHKY